MASGPAAGLALVDALLGRAGAQELLPPARACAATCSSSSAASTRRRDELERAATLTKNAREQALLRERAAPRADRLWRWLGRHHDHPGAHRDGEITVAAPRARVWEALTKPELVKQYFFGTQW